jgi:hypothetical protein
MVDFSLQTLHDPANNELLSSEVAENQFPMLTQRTGDLLHGLAARNAWSADTTRPGPCPPRRANCNPRVAGRLLEKVSTEVVAEEIAQAEALLGLQTQ